MVVSRDTDTIDVQSRVRLTARIPVTLVDGRWFVTHLMSVGHILTSRIARKVLIVVTAVFSVSNNEEGSNNDVMMFLTDSCS